MKLFLSLLSVCLLALALLSCEREPVYKINARLDAELLEYLKSQRLENSTLLLSSGGGDASAGIAIGELLASKRVTLKVQRFCISACSEFLLPAADRIEFIDDPIVGFHWSPLMDVNQHRRHGADMSKCKSTNLPGQLRLLERNRLRPDFWQETEKRLNLTHFEFVYKGQACPWKTREFENHLWLPTSDQLRSLWGLKFEGTLCSDDIKQCQLKIDRLWEQGTRIVVGDEVYISRGKT